MKHACKLFAGFAVCIAILLAATSGPTADAAGQRVFTADFSDLLGYVDMQSYDRNGLSTSDDRTAAVNVWVDQKFDMYYSRECHTFQQRNTLGEAIDTGRGDSYWNIDFFGESLRATNAAGGEYLRSCESLTVKYNGEAAVLENFEATVTYTYTTAGRGGVYITFHEKTPGKFGWQVNPTNRADHSFIEQDAVMVVTPESGTLTKAGFSGLLVKEYDESFEVSLGTVKGVPQYTGHLDELFTSGLNTTDTYQLYVKAVNGDVTVKLTNTANGTVLVDKSYAGAATGEAGTLSVGVANICALSDIEIKELDENGKQVDFGTMTATMYPSVLTATTIHLPTTTNYVAPKGVRPTAKSTAVTDSTTAATVTTTEKAATVTQDVTATAAATDTTTAKKAVTTGSITASTDTTTPQTDSKAVGGYSWPVTVGIAVVCVAGAVTTVLLLRKRTR